MSNKKIIEMFKPITELSNKVSEALQPLSTTMSSILNTIADFYEKLKRKNFTEKEIDHYINIYSSYAKFGWSIPFNTDILFKKVPKNLESTDKKLIKFCTKKEIENCFSYILLNNYIKQEDFEEAKFCFYKKKYKACILLLYSIIDCLIICLQPPKNARHRKTSETLNNLDTAIKNNDNYYIFYLCRYTATLICLKTLYSNGNDFITQPQLPNRNFISHGMFKRQITKTDCIKIFILIENLCFTINHLKLQLYI